MSQVEKSVSPTKQTKSKDKSSIDKNSKLRRAIKKFDKIRQKKRMNALICRLVSPKSPLIIFSELFKDVPIHLDEYQCNDILYYTATIEIDGQVFARHHNSKNHAKHLVCETYFRYLLANEIYKPIEKKEETPTNIKIVDAENGTVPKPKEPPQGDFLWPHFASLAMYNLMRKWGLNHGLEITNFIKSEPKIGGRKKFPEDPKNINPVQLLKQMKPGLQFTETSICLNSPKLILVTCEIDGTSFTGQGASKKAALKECCIAAIKFFWQFDYHAIDDD